MTDFVVPPTWAGAVLKAAKAVAGLKQGAWPDTFVAALFTALEEDGKMWRGKGFPFPQAGIGAYSDMKPMDPDDFSALIINYGDSNG